MIEEQQTAVNCEKKTETKGSFFFRFWFPTHAPLIVDIKNDEEMFRNDRRKEKKKNCHSRTGRFRYEMIFHSFSFFFIHSFCSFCFTLDFIFPASLAARPFEPPSTSAPCEVFFRFFFVFFRFFFLNLSLFLGVFWVCGLCDDVTIFIHSAKRLGNAAFQLRNDNKKATRFSTKD